MKMERLNNIAVYDINLRYRLYKSDAALDIVNFNHFRSLRQRNPGLNNPENPFSYEKQA